MTIASVDAQLLSAHPPSQLEVTVFFFWRRWDDFGKEGRFLGWKLNATKVIMVYNGYYINYGYNGLQWL